MLLYALTIFASAFLLFLVQPIIAKEILPWFGGSAAVWTTCLVFFQSALLAGYAYADASIRRLSQRGQVSLHSALLVGSLLLLPIVPGVLWKPLGTESPLWLILGLLAATIGAPYLLLSTTSPLLQAWFAQHHPGRNPYRLFALSNFASMLALVAYPFAIEPWIATHTQAIAWSAGYASFAALCIATAVLSTRAAAQATAAGPETGALDIHAASHSDGEPMPGIGRHLLWASLAAIGSVLLLSVTTHITENIAAVPLLWIVPLSIYLITFILCFESSRWYPRSLLLPLAAVALSTMSWAIADPRVTHALALQLGVTCIGLLLACMFCHGELARLRPAPHHLTRFYLMVSLGGALGAFLVGIVVPVVLPAHFELALGLVACAALLAWQVRRGGRVFGALALATAVVTIGCAIWGIVGFYDATIVTARNFYGVLRVQEFGRGASRHRSLIHGTILHGTQYLAPELRRRATTYYTETSGIGRVLESLNPRTQPLKVGVIGLGTGTLAVYGAKGATWRFYDINPAVIKIARTEFTYLADSDANVETVLGDARLSLEREPPQHFDVLAIDAFSSDAIPVHLITSEALGVYLRHMKPDGVIAFHVTNRYLDLVPVVAALARAHGMRAVWIPDPGTDVLASKSDWVLVSSNSALLSNPRVAEAATPIHERPDWRLWTDDFNNLFQVLRR
jgi:SAM-dependent methyltransferase